MGLWDTMGDLIGKTIKDFNLTSVECHRPDEGVQLIGIAPWGLAHREGFWKKDGVTLQIDEEIPRCQRDSVRVILKAMYVFDP